ncbi:hypothetical protein [Hyphomicrobium sp.]|uniref:hypothetical protein n=1 Tax=Hyphomicrobium sp. TaxID=82 RepID=UPI000FB91673|nr:hypothetical protein [Hyphomicrobium sp.]RUO99975.1 MAG: hypothetical protein EKK30_02325 [Hyphomicrobium sp.]
MKLLNPRKTSTVCRPNYAKELDYSNGSVISERYFDVIGKRAQGRYEPSPNINELSLEFARPLKMRLKFFAYWLQNSSNLNRSMSNFPDPPDKRQRPPASSPVLLALLCAVLVALATWTIFLVR